MIPPRKVMRSVNREPRRYTKRIGSTNYRVGIYYSLEAKETLDEKVLRLLEISCKKELKKVQCCDRINVLQTERLPEGSSL